jgi:endonuclease/exonuclease/phosphatase family metal-dependent hydrolase
VQSVVKTCLWIVLIVAAARAETLTIATYNVENYVAADRMTEAGYRKDYPKPETEKQALRTVIRGLHADILALQEMGAAPYLDELRRDLRADGLDYPYALLLEGPDPDRHVALLARRVPKSVKSHANLEFTYFGAREKVKRGLLEATFATPAGDLTVFALHLKSRFTDRPDDPLSAVRRGAEAIAVRDAVLERFPSPDGARYLILGDCNDSKESKAVQHLLRRGRTGVSELLPAMDSRGEVWTHYYHTEDSYSRVDHILVSPALHAAVEGGAAHIYDAPETRLASDHRPVVVMLKLEKP